VSASPVPGRRLRLGMVGGGEGAFIGNVHRMASRLDDEWSLVAGALSSDPERARSSAAVLRLDPGRSYTDFAEMARREAERTHAGGDGIDAVAIVTPNHLHAPVALAFLDAGIDVICDKPLALTLAEGRLLADAARANGRFFAVTYNYSGYPMVRRARALVREGRLGALRAIQVEYAQDWLGEAIEASGHKQAAWRTDPALSGHAGCLGDIGTHAYHLACFVSGLVGQSVSAELSTLVPGRQVDDHVQAMLRFGGDVRGTLWASQVASGAANGLRLRVHGDRASLEFDQQRPDELLLREQGGNETRLRRGRTPAGATEHLRLPGGHPEGFIEAFAQLYRDAAQVIRARQAGEAPPASAADLSMVTDGVKGLAFVAATLQSSAAAGQWTPIEAEVAAPAK
jgi:predicted dehydrogenase